MSGLLSVFSGVRVAAGDHSQVVVIGLNKLIKQLSFTGNLAAKLGAVGVDDRTFTAAIEQICECGPSSIPLYLNLARIVSVSDDISRHNTPSNAYSIFKEIKDISARKGVNNLNVVLYTEYAHAFASFCAVARCFPLFSRKSASNAADKFFQKIDVEIVITNEDKQLTNSDLKFLQDVGYAIRECSALVDTPCNELHTEALTDAALSMVKDIDGVTSTVIKGDELLKNGFGGIYHVGKAAAHPPVFLCLNYTPSGATETYALVGKGIVFDTGGMQIKPKTGMPSMKNDMGGAAAVLGAFYALTRAGFSQNLHCLMCIAENSVSPHATRPDDVIRLLSGKLVEINNTDAEGRLVLADGVFYAKNMLHANTIVDIATLTGYQKFATGVYHAGILANNETIEESSIQAGKKSGDLVYPFIYAPELHFSDLKSEIADFKNACLGEAKGVPSAVAGLFVGKQIDYGTSSNEEKTINWLHIDMAAPITTGQRCTGFGVAHLCALLSKHIDVEVAQILN